MRVTIQQAANNALAAWLASKLTTDIVVEPRWPTPDKLKTPKMVTLTLAGSRRDTPIDLRLLSYSAYGDKQTNAVWQVAACTQPVQLDVWAPTDVELDDILAQLDDALHVDQFSLPSALSATPAGTGCLVALADGWDACGTIADFSFDSPDVDVTSDAQARRLYRASYRGESNFMLTVNSTTARQVAINFQLMLSETDSDFATRIP